MVISQISQTVKQTTTLITNEANYLKNSKKVFSLYKYRENKEWEDQVKRFQGVS
jgi:hypothetical protein